MDGTQASGYGRLLAALQHHFPQGGPTGGEADSFVEFTAIVGSASDALLYAGLFCPPLMEIEGMVFPRLQWVGPDEPREAARDIRMAVERHRGDLRGGERSYNRVELAGLFAEYELTDREEDLLAKFLVGAWTGWLHTSFPDRCFVLELMRADETGEGLEITFYEQR